MADDDGTSADDGGSSSGDRLLLESDRKDVGNLVRKLTPALVADLGGTASNARGSYRGCRGRTPEGIAAMEYVATVRIDAGASAPDDLLEPVLSHLGGPGNAVTSQVPGGRRVTAPLGTGSVTVTTRPKAGRFLILSANGGCHDIPADEQHEWLDRGVDDLT